ncbi:MAG: PEP-CTERM sorting domain-containing protein [Phycisphaerae bacterium]|jgi:hypothetical protein
MKRLLTVCIVTAFILNTAGSAAADNIIPPEWVGADRTVHAEWDSWTDFNSPMPPDNWGSTPGGLDSPSAHAGLASLWESLEGKDNVIQLNGDDELLFDMPNFTGGDFKEVWVQVTYFQMPDQYPFFNVYTEEENWYMTELVPKGSATDANGWVTEAWSFQIYPNPEWETIMLSFSTNDDGGPMITSTGGTAYPAYVDQVVIDTMCVPEPATIAMLGFGSLILFRRNKNTNTKKG